MNVQRQRERQLLTVRQMQPLRSTHFDATGDAPEAKIEEQTERTRGLWF